MFEFSGQEDREAIFVTGLKSQKPDTPDNPLGTNAQKGFNNISKP
jgi:hypothetical protein